ncbi:MAG: Wzz/FepE/Etk N-terminal domain-containing protein [Thermodesulfobacteriota bacterium]|nr:Wzz/FepE/Etk N-terminal domain-containing protein [Thermodesulfobacteriota bacterium]
MEIEKEEEITFIDYWQVIWKWKILIILIVVAGVLISGIKSLYQVDIYRSEAVIIPIEQGETGGVSSLMQQLGGIPGMAMTGSSSSEIVNILNSKILREKVIKRYNLLPVFFYEQWDKERNDWKREKKKRGFKLNPFALIRKLIHKIKPDPPRNPGKIEKGKSGSPTMWDGLRALNSITGVSKNVRDNTVRISIEFYDPEMAAKIVHYFLDTLIHYMTNEAKRVATINKKYLEQQLAKTSDPLIRQKVYNLIAQQIEAAMMSEVKENFAFKLIDPPRVPDRKVKPNRQRAVMMGFAVSLFFGILLAYFLEYIRKVKAIKETK